MAIWNVVILCIARVNFAIRVERDTHIGPGVGELVSEGLGFLPKFRMLATTELIRAQKASQVTDSRLENARRGSGSGYMRMGRRYMHT